MAKKAEPKSTWKNRILRSAEVDPLTLTANVNNFRKHPAFQKQAMTEVLENIGWIQDVIVNETTGNMIDGHLRVELAIRKKEPTIPVKYVSLSPEEEQLALLTFDPIGEYARHDSKLLKTLLDNTDELPVGPSIRTLLEDEANEVGLVLKEFESQDSSNLDAKRELGGNSKNRSKDEDDTRIYDGRDDATDVGTGPCPYKCLYCFTAASRAALSWKGLRPKAPGEMTKSVNSAARNTRLLEIGSANDPSIPQFIEPLKEALIAAKKAKVYILLQTKNPGYFCDILRELEFPLNQVTVRSSFATCSDEISAQLEPGTYSPSQRIEGLLELHSMGVETCLRLSPFILGVETGLPATLKALKNKCTILTVELLRVSATAENNHFARINGIVAPNWTITEHFDRWGRKGTQSTYGAARWYDYDPELVRPELIRLKELAHRHGMLFSLENYETTFSNCDLNDGLHPIDTPNIQKFGVKLHPDVLTTLVKQNRIPEVRCDYLRGVPKGSAEWHRRLWTVILANDSQRPLLTEQKELNDGKKEGRQKDRKEGR